VFIINYLDLVELCIWLCIEIIYYPLNLITWSLHLVIGVIQFLV